MSSKPVKDTETASVASTSTFSSTVRLLEGVVKSKLPRSKKKQSQNPAITTNTSGCKDSHSASARIDEKTRRFLPHYLSTALKKKKSKKNQKMQWKRIFHNHLGDGEQMQG
jgi:hypothetical protein